MENLNEDLISTSKSVYVSTRRFDLQKLTMVILLLIIVLLLLTIMFILPSFPYCYKYILIKNSATDNNDDVDFHLNTSSYFDYGINNDCPILFKQSGHDDFSYGKFTIKQPFYFFKNTFNFFYIHSNGFISFKYYDPNFMQTFPIQDVSVIAPFWSDIDLRFAGSIYHREINETNLLDMFNVDIRALCPSLNFNPVWAYMITWADAPAYLSQQDRYGSKSQYKNVFQLMLATNGQDTSFAIFNYVRLDWPNEFINTTFQAGYNSENSVYGLLDKGKNTSKLITGSNIKKPGRWVLPLNDKLNCYKELPIK